MRHGSSQDYFERLTDKAKKLKEWKKIAEVPSLHRIVDDTKQLAERAMSAELYRFDVLELVMLAAPFASDVLEACKGRDEADLNDLEPSFEEFSRALAQMLESLEGPLKRTLHHVIVDATGNDQGTIDKCHNDLVTAIRTFEQKPIVLQHLGMLSTASIHLQPSSRHLSDRLIFLANLLRGLRAMAGMVPFPGIKGVVDTLSHLVDAVLETKSNDDELCEMADEAADFMLKVEQKYRTSNFRGLDNFQKAINSLEDALKQLATRVQQRTGRTFAHRLFTREPAKVADCRKALQDAIDSFKWDVQSSGMEAIYDRLTDMAGRVRIRDKSLTTFTLPEMAQCMDGTRGDQLWEIAEWITNVKDSERVLWLTGASGMGKSTIAQHVARAVKYADRLAAHVFFTPTREPLDLVIREIASQLAYVNSNSGGAINLDLNSREVYLDSMTMFRELVLKPLRSMLESNWVVIFDGLGQYDDHSMLLNILSRFISSFPTTIKVFITSHPETATDALLRDIGAKHLQLPKGSDDEIRHFFSTKLHEFPTEHQLTQLVERTSGLFLYASLACNFILDLKSSDRAEHRLETVLSHKRQEVDLQDMYVTALTHHFDGESNAQNFRFVTGVLLVANAPITRPALRQLLQHTCADVTFVLSRLRCIQISTSISSDQPVTLTEHFHMSFREFITDPKNAPFYINPQDQHSLLAEACLRCMDGFFNPSSAPTPKFTGLYRTPVPEGVLYAVNNWVSHLSHGGLPSVDLIRAMHCFSQNLNRWTQFLRNPSFQSVAETLSQIHARTSSVMHADLVFDTGSLVKEIMNDVYMDHLFPPTFAAHARATVYSCSASTEPNPLASTLKDVIDRLGEETVCSVLRDAVDQAFHPGDRTGSEILCINIHRCDITANRPISCSDIDPPDNNAAMSVHGRYLSSTELLRQAMDSNQVTLNTHITQQFCENFCSLIDSFVEARDDTHSLVSDAFHESCRHAIQKVLCDAGSYSTGKNGISERNNAFHDNETDRRNASLAENVQNNFPEGNESLHDHGTGDRSVDQNNLPEGNDTLYPSDSDHLSVHGEDTSDTLQERFVYIEGALAVAFTKLLNEMLLDALRDILVKAVINALPACPSTALSHPDVDKLLSALREVCHQCSTAGTHANHPAADMNSRDGGQDIVDALVDEAAGKMAHELASSQIEQLELIIHKVRKAIRFGDIGVLFDATSTSKIFTLAIHSLYEKLQSEPVDKVQDWLGRHNAGTRFISPIGLPVHPCQVLVNLIWRLSWVPILAARHHGTNSSPPRSYLMGFLLILPVLEVVKGDIIILETLTKLQVYASRLAAQPRYAYGEFQFPKELEELLEKMEEEVMLVGK